MQVLQLTALFLLISGVAYGLPSADWGIRRLDDGLVQVQLPSLPVDHWGSIALHKAASSAERFFAAQTICVSLGQSAQGATAFLSNELQHTAPKHHPVLKNLSCHSAQSHISNCAYSIATLADSGDNDSADVFVQCGQERVFLTQDEMSNGGATDPAALAGLAVVSFSSHEEAIGRCLASQLQVDTSRFVFNLTATSLRQEYKYFMIVVNSTKSEFGSVEVAARIFFEEGSTTGTDTLAPARTSTSTTTTTTALPTTTKAPATTTTTAQPTTTKAPATTTTTTTTKAPAATTQPTTTKAPAATTQPTTTKAPAATTQPTTTKAPVTTAPSLIPSARTSSRSFSASINALENNQLANSVVSHLLQLLPPERLFECGIYELRSGEGLLETEVPQAVPRGGSFDLARVTLANHSEPSVGFGKLIKKFPGLPTRSTSCGLWDDVHATEVCRALAPNGTTPNTVHGFAVNSIATDQGNNLPILDQYLPVTRASSESAYFDKTNACTHGDDAGVMCSFFRRNITFGFQRVYRVVSPAIAGPEKFESALSVLIPSSTGRLNITQSAASRHGEFVMQFTPFCGKASSSVPEVELLDSMLEWIDVTALTRLSQISEISILSTVQSHHCDTVSATATLSLAIEQVIVYLRLNLGSNTTFGNSSNGNNSNETTFLQMRLALFLRVPPQNVEFVEVPNLPGGYVAVRLPSLAMALFLEGAVNQGLIDGFLSATLDIPSPTSSHDDSTGSRGPSVVVIVIGTVCGLLGGFVLVVAAVVVWRKNSNRKEVRFDEDGAMNTLFLPLDLSMLMELEEMKSDR